MSIQILLLLIVQLLCNAACTLCFGRAGFLGSVFGALVFWVLIGAGAFK